MQLISLLSTAAVATAFAPTAGKASTSKLMAYNPADFSNVQNLPGILDPVGFFDPAGLSEGVSESELKRFREAELTRGAARKSKTHRVDAAATTRMARWGLGG